MENRLFIGILTIKYFQMGDGLVKLKFNGFKGSKTLCGIFKGRDLKGKYDKGIDI
jgi:hypothetical protein